MNVNPNNNCNLTWKQRREIYMRLEFVAHGNGDTVPHGMFTKLEIDYPCRAKAISAVWKEMRKKVKQYFGANPYYTVLLLLLTVCIIQH